MIDWRGIRDFVRGDPVLKWFFLPLTVAPFALLLWGWLGGVVLAITDSEFWMLATGTERGAGVVLGIIGGGATLTAGHILNAWLTRRRDDRLREEKAKALASALGSEFQQIGLMIENLLDNYAIGQEGNDGMPAGLEAALSFWMPNQPVYKASVGTIGILGPYLCGKIVGTAEGAHSTILFVLHNIYNEDGTIIQDEAQAADLRVLADMTIGLWRELHVRAGLPLDHPPTPE